jgi:branched-chain amino acid transport system permease protein
MKTGPDMELSHSRQSARSSARLRRYGALVPRIRSRGVGFAGWVVILVLVPSVIGNGNVGVADLVLLAIIGAVALNLLQGVAGQLSVGNAAFMAVGAFAAGSLVTYAHTPFLVTIIGSAVAGAIVGFIVGIPALRARGLYLLLGTLALQYVATYAFISYQDAANQPGGFELPLPTLGPWHIESETDWYILFAVVATAAIWVMSSVLRSSFGRTLLAVRESEALAASLGISVVKNIVLCFTITSCMIGIEGGLFAYYVGVVQSDSFTLALAIQYLAMVLLGGEGSVAGPVLGAIVIEALPYVLNNFLPTTGALASDGADIQQIIYGLLIIAVLVFEPGGLGGLGSRLIRWMTSRVTGRLPRFAAPMLPGERSQER